MIKEKILVIDDEAGIRSSLKGILEDEGYDITVTDTGEKGLEIFKNENFDLVFLDIWLPEKNGLEILSEIKTYDDNSQVVMITGHGSVESAVKATKLGAYDFLEKPLSLEKVVQTVKNALQHKNLLEESLLYRDKLKARYQLVGESKAIQNLRSQISTAAPTDARILFYGENGTGKEFVARLIHQASSRKNKRFVQLNCAAIPDNLIERELFGYVKGTFSDDEKDKKGKLLQADGGTLFLDEIGEMNISTQSKLERVIVEQKFEPIGSIDPININTRFISASENDLRELISKGKFRKDLFFKLSVIPMSIPPLRERKEDIPLLIDYFLNYFCIEYGKKKKTMTKEAMKAFINYSWPGNVSELINVIERFVIMIKDDEIKESHLYLLVEPLELQLIPDINSFVSLDKATMKFEREYIHKALIRNEWDLTKTAKELDLNRNQLNQKIVDLGITFLG
ncbi:MAG: sigma-54-dependent Fis family transcriptional regulator [Candidatus Aminicenantes bacterium]|nr:sigma-54-dependent Fis family transcriptional regulator [Candidatus Aminicenantes bacterium]